MSRVSPRHFFYSYICIDKELLIENLDGDAELANKAIAVLVEAAVKVPPKGKQNSFATRAYASYVLAERVVSNLAHYP